MAANLDSNNTSKDLPVACPEDEPVLSTSLEVTQLNESSLSAYPPSSFLLAPHPQVSREETEAEIEGDTDQEEGPGEKAGSEHSSVTNSILEPQICRTCGPDEETHDDVLVQLGCQCRGDMSSMHRKCILQWYGVRMILKRNYKCEICEDFLHPRVQMELFLSVADGVDGGRDTIMAALRSEIGRWTPGLNIDSAATYPELTQLLHRHHHISTRQHQHHIVDVQVRRVRRAEQRRLGPSECLTAACVMVTVFVLILGILLFMLLHPDFYEASRATLNDVDNFSA